MNEEQAQRNDQQTDPTTEACAGTEGEPAVVGQVELERRQHLDDVAIAERVNCPPLGQLVEQYRSDDDDDRSDQPRPVCCRRPGIGGCVHVRNGTGRHVAAVGGRWSP